MYTVKDYEAYVQRRDDKIRKENGIPEGKPIPREVYAKYQTVETRQDTSPLEVAVICGAIVIVPTLCVYVLVRFWRPAVTKLIAWAILAKRNVVSATESILHDAKADADKSRSS